MAASASAMRARNCSTSSRASSAAWVGETPRASSAPAPLGGEVGQLRLRFERPASGAALREPRLDRAGVERGQHVAPRDPVALVHRHLDEPTCPFKGERLRPRRLHPAHEATRDGGVVHHLQGREPRHGRCRSRGGPVPASGPQPVSARGHQRDREQKDTRPSRRRTSEGAVSVVMARDPLNHQHYKPSHARHTLKAWRWRSSGATAYTGRSPLVRTAGSRAVRRCPGIREKLVPRSRSE